MNKVIKNLQEGWWFVKVEWRLLWLLMPISFILNLIFLALLSFGVESNKLTNFTNFTTLFALLVTILSIMCFTCGNDDWKYPRYPIAVWSITVIPLYIILLM